MNGVRVKICGLTRPQDMEAAVRAGAEFLGLVFAPGSPRCVTVEQVQPWLDEARGDAEVVGVFRDQPADEVLAIAHALDLDLLQLHGQESGPQWHGLPLRVIEARVVAGDALPGPRLPGHAWAQLLDGGAGEGRAFDWGLAEEVVRAERVFLAGGLHPANVAEAVRQVGPFAVDVSSGVESAPGHKDPELVARFIAAARGAEA